MRKFVLIAAMVLASASAQAAGSGGLALAANDEPATSWQPAPEAAPADVPKYVERPSAVDTKGTADQPMVDGKRNAKSDAKPIAKAGKKRHHESTEARVIYELHRHGIYW
jgi:hypothetical protein